MPVDFPDWLCVLASQDHKSSTNSLALWTSKGGSTAHDLQQQRQDHTVSAQACSLA